MHNGTSPYEWAIEMTSSACLGIVDFIAFFAALRETKVEADRMTFPLSPSEYDELLDVLATAQPETDDDSEDPSGQERLQKLQQQLERNLHWQVPLPELADLISYITTRIRLRPFLNGPSSLRYSSALGHLEVRSPNATPIHFWFKQAAGRIFTNGIKKKLKEISSSHPFVVSYHTECCLEGSPDESSAVDAMIYCENQLNSPSSNDDDDDDDDKVPLLAIEVDFTHKTSDQKIRLIQYLCQKYLYKEFVPILRLQVEMRFLSERLQNPGKPYKVSADLIAVDKTRGLHEPLQDDEYLFKQRLICAGVSSDNGNSTDTREEADSLDIPLEIVDDSIPTGAFASVPCEKLRSAFAQAVKKANKDDRGRPLPGGVEGDGARMTASQDNQ